ncbi:TrkH family potassium uptake protein [Tepidicaulis sp. LMO-SS28]|uniref:TrkH family potassium uptake protein n=1 Tax=Tepidicaulis sp. LMO-SS28 TaxID=3447455 RepID=UPI003EDF0605
MHINPVVHIVGLLLCGLAGVMLLPALVDIAYAHPDWQSFVISAAVTGGIGGLLVILTHSKERVELDLKQSFLLTASCWVVLPAFAALPLIGIGLSYTDAFFEAVSGITTTGSTVISGLDTLPYGILLWRALLQWVGGIGIIVMAIVLLPFLRVGGMQLFRIESSERSEKIVPQAFKFVAYIASAYAALTAFCVLGYRLAGMSAFDAICHAMATLSTGGYSTHDASFGYFGTLSAQWVGTLFMIAGALPFVVYVKFMRGNRGSFWQDQQVHGFLYFLAAVIAIITFWRVQVSETDFWTAFTEAAFNITSIVTTTGFASTDYSLWGPAAVGAFFFLTFVGGCAGSTSGAIKIYRFQILWTLMRAKLLQLTSPNRIVPMHYNGQRIPKDVPDSVLAFLTAFMGTVAAFTFALTLMGLDFVTALTASATAITNVGPGLGEVVGPAGNFTSLPDGAKWLLSLAMLFGRLEIFALLLLFDPAFWRD